MTFDRECELCDDVCYQEFYSKREINDFIPEYQEFDEYEVKSIMKFKPLKGKILIVKPFTYHDCRCICDECFEEWKNAPNPWEKRGYVKPKRGDVVSEWR